MLKNAQTTAQLHSSHTLWERERDGGGEEPRMKQKDMKHMTEETLNN